MGGIGVFFPGTTGFATEENSPLNTPLVTNHKKPDYAQIGEYMAFVAAGGSKAAGLPFERPVNGAPALPEFTEPFGRIDLAGITLNLFGPGGLEGLNHLLTFGANARRGLSERRHQRARRCGERHTARRSRSTLRLAGDSAHDAGG